MEADIAMLEWLKLAAGAGELAFTEDFMALGGELQLQRLKEARSRPTHHTHTHTSRSTDPDRLPTSPQPSDPRPQTPRP